MNDITLCTMHTEKPYYIKEINKNIYSIEELSYYLFNYLYLIDDQFFSEGLIDYIEKKIFITICFLKRYRCPMASVSSLYGLPDYVAHRIHRLAHHTRRGVRV